MLRNFLYYDAQTIGLVECFKLKGRTIERSIPFMLPFQILLQDRMENNCTVLILLIAYSFNKGLVNVRTDILKFYVGPGLMYRSRIMDINNF